jgi:GNAT superfamily N-acetyltransferase
VLNWLLPVSFAVVAGAGALWGLHLRNNRPDIYRNIGLGAASVVEPLSADPADDSRLQSSYPNMPPLPAGGDRVGGPSSMPSLPRLPAQRPNGPAQPPLPNMMMPRLDNGEPQAPYPHPHWPPMQPHLPPAVPQGPGGPAPARGRVISAQKHYSIEPIAHLMAATYFNDSLTQWLIPDIQTNGQVYTGYFRVVVAQAMNAGLIDVLDDYSGAAIWYPVKGPLSVFTPPRESPVIGRLSANLAWRLNLLHHAAELARPTETHSFLAFAAVWPNEQRRGIGTTLLSHRLQKLDGRGTPAYVEATSVLSVSLYSRLGFQMSGEPITLPSGPSIYPMWRPANKPAPIDAQRTTR